MFENRLNKVLYSDYFYGWLFLYSVNKIWQVIIFFGYSSFGSWLYGHTFITGKIFLSSLYLWFTVFCYITSFYIMKSVWFFRLDYYLMRVFIYFVINEILLPLFGLRQILFLYYHFEKLCSIISQRLYLGSQSVSFWS